MLLDYYQQQCQLGFIQSDPEQLAALDAFQVVLDHLKHHQKSSGWLRLRKPKPVQGLYIWGGVGIGKTLLMDCFFHCIPFPQKWRLHFHAFMQFIHQELKKWQGSADPLRIIARELTKKYRVICFDEFIVHDIVDAMLLTCLLKVLMQHGICFVTTSNTMPDELYKNGLQRTSFLPAIALIKEHLRVIHLPSSQDYRMLQISKAGAFFTPDDAAAEASMEKVFLNLAHGHEISSEPLLMHDRSVAVIRRAPEIVWFDFKVICHIPRSQQDYLALVGQYKIIFLSHVPCLDSSDKNTAYLFIRFIDVLYDARIALILSASAPLEQIFAGLSTLPEALRTLSRLVEMQSEKYFSNSSAS